MMPNDMEAYAKKPLSTSVGLFMLSQQTIEVITVTLFQYITSLVKSKSRLNYDSVNYFWEVGALKNR